MFQNEAPCRARTRTQLTFARLRRALSRATARQARTQTRTLRPSTWLLLKAMGAGPAGRITYAAGGRLDGIGRRAIGDMVSSAVASSFETIGTLRERPTQPLSPDIDGEQAGCRCMQFDRETGVGGSATGSGPRVGEWLCNDLWPRPRTRHIRRAFRGPRSQRGRVIRVRA